MEIKYLSSEVWYIELLNVAARHNCVKLVRDKEAWCECWQDQTPEECFYDEYPEYRED